MGSYDNIVKIEEMRKYMEEGNVQSAQKILDTMEIRKIKNISDLSLIAEVYAENERYEEAIALYVKIYNKTKSRKSLFQLVNLSILSYNLEDAQDYLDEYQRLAPKDFYKYIFRYKIDKIKGEPYEKLIETLETLKKTEYIEQWAYELAKTYYKAGRDQDCIRECSDIILWFGEGVYVEKAKMLKSYFIGETDKEKIMEELKRRALEDTGKHTPISLEKELSKERSKDQKHTQKKTELQEDMNSSKEKEYELAMQENTDSEGLAEEEAIEDIENYLKSHIENIFLEEFEQEKEEKGMMGEAEEPVIGKQKDQNKESMSAEERELAEQEVEAALYQLLEEEELDEEDKRLEKIAKEQRVEINKIFGNFLHVKAIKKQLVNSLEQILDESRIPQIMITGAKGSGKTTLAKEFTLFLNKCARLKSSKIAKINAEKLNTIDIMSKKDTLKGCCLVVENASELQRLSIERILELCSQLEGNIAVIFEEDKANMNKLFLEYPKLIELIQNRIHLPEYMPKDLIEFAYACLRQQNYRLNPKAGAILGDRINLIAKQTEPQLQLQQIDQLMQNVMNAADIRMGKLLSNIEASEKLEEADVLTVLPEDFLTP
jgi:hypothetical protein